MTVTKGKPVSVREGEIVKFLKKFKAQLWELLLMVITMVLVAGFGPLFKVSQDKIELVLLVLFAFFLGRIMVIGLGEKTNQEIYDLINERLPLPKKKNKPPEPRLSLWQRLKKLFGK